jgi:hypothetical protein
MPSSSLTICGGARVDEPVRVLDEMAAPAGRLDELVRAVGFDAKP